MDRVAVDIDLCPGTPGGFAVPVIEATASYQCVILLVSGDGWVVQGYIIAILLLGRICESLLVSNIYLLF